MGVVFITGATRGIGAHPAIGLASDGHQVIAASRSGHRPGGAAPDLKIRAMVANVNDDSSMSQAMDRAVAEFGRVDVAIANAGVGYFAPVEIMPRRP